jgi:hypothetical protein
VSVITFNVTQRNDHIGKRDPNLCFLGGYAIGTSISQWRSLREMRATSKYAQIRIQLHRLLDNIEGIFDVGAQD